MYIYNSDKDPIERGLINLATAQVEFNEESEAMVRVGLFILELVIYVGLQ